MPSGVAPVTVLEPAAAALAAAKIFALTDPAVQDAVLRFQQDQTRKIMSDDEELRS
jgi:phosphoribosylcarboxyaminoimidazole (NCAIR) mutase